MVTLITVIHVLAAIFLVLIVLLQSGKGASLGAAFGGSSQTVFGVNPTHGMTWRYPLDLEKPRT